MLDKKIKIGDEIYVEQAWEDESGAYHDEYAIVQEIDDKGFMKLKFDKDEVNDFLADAEYNVKDFEQLTSD